MNATHPIQDTPPPAAHHEFDDIFADLLGPRNAPNEANNGASASSVSSHPILDGKPIVMSCIF